MKHFSYRAYYYLLCTIITCSYNNDVYGATDGIRAPRQDTIIIPEPYILPGFEIPRDFEARLIVTDTLNAITISTVDLEALNAIISGTLTVTNLVVTGTCSGTCGGGTSNLYVLKTGDTMTGSLTITGGHELLLADATNGNTVSFVAPNGLSASYTLTFPIDTGAPNTFLTSDGTGALSWTTISGSGITSLNGQTGIAQTFANGFSGTTPAFNSASNVHTLNIPMAHTTGVTAGLISYTEFNALSTATSVLTSATSVNIPNTLVLRDNNGSFSANIITATFVGNLTGNVTGTATYAINASSALTSNTANYANTAGSAITSTSFTGNLFGDVTGTQGATVVSTICGIPACNLISSITTGTSANIPNTLVLRDNNGSFSANIITATFVGNLTGNVTGTATYATNASSALTSNTANYANTAGSAITSTSFTGNLFGDVTGTQGATVVSTICGTPACNLISSITTGTSANIPNTLVLRDNNGSFSANIITATLVGNLTGNVTGTATYAINAGSALISNTANYANTAGSAITSTSFTGNLLGDVTGTQGATVVSTICGIPACNLISSITTSTSANIPNTLVLRDNNGNFTSSIVTVSGIALVTPNSLNSILLQAPSALTQNYTYTLPSTYGVPGYFLQTDGIGTLTWAATASTAITSINSLTTSAQYLTTNTTTLALIPEFDEISSATHALQIPMAHTPGVVAGLISNAEFNSFGTTISGTFYRQGGNDFGMDGTLGLTSANTLNIITNDISRIAIDPAGAVSINSATSGTTLTVFGSSGSDAQRIMPALNQVGLQIDGNGVAPAAILTTVGTGPGLDVESLGVGTGIVVNASTGTGNAAYFIGNSNVPALVIDGNTLIRFNNELQLGDATANYIAFKAPETLSQNYTYTWPSNYGLAGYVLQTEGDGLLTWTPGGSGSSGIISINGLTSANQYLATTTTTVFLIPQFTTLSTTTQLLELPMAHSSGVIAGLISNAEFNAFGTTISGTFFRQGGNDFGMDGVLGVTSANTLNIITDNITRLAITDNGNVTISPPDNGLLLTVSGGAHVTGTVGTFTADNVFNVGLPSTLTGITNTPRQTQQLCLALTASGTDADSNHIRVFVFPIIQFAAGTQSSGFYTTNFCDTAKIDPTTECMACGFVMIPNGLDITTVLVGSRLSSNVNNIYANSNFNTMTINQQTAATNLINNLGYPTWQQDAMVFVLVTLGTAPSAETDFSIMQIFCVG